MMRPLTYLPTVKPAKKVLTDTKAGALTNNHRHSRQFSIIKTKNTIPCAAGALVIPVMFSILKLSRPI